MAAGRSKGGDQLGNVNHGADWPALRSLVWWNSRCWLASALTARLDGAGRDQHAGAVCDQRWSLLGAHVAADLRRPESHGYA
jgi:hypothetical protein